MSWGIATAPQGTLSQSALRVQPGIMAPLPAPPVAVPVQDRTEQVAPALESARATLDFQGISVLLAQLGIMDRIVQVRLSNITQYAGKKQNKNKSDSSLRVWCRSNVIELQYHWSVHLQPQFWG